MNGKWGSLEEFGLKDCHWDCNPGVISLVHYIFCVALPHFADRSPYVEIYHWWGESWGHANTIKTWESGDQDSRWFCEESAVSRMCLCFNFLIFQMR